MISLEETLIAYLQADPTLYDLVGDRIAPRHRYADAWPAGAVALTVKLSGALPDLTRGHQVSNIDLHIYGPTAESHLPVYARLVAISRATHNAEVATSQGVALLRFALIESQPVYLADPDTGMPYTFLTINAAAAETPIRS